MTKVRVFYNRSAILFFIGIAIWCYAKILGGVGGEELSTANILPSVLLVVIFCIFRMLVNKGEIDWLAPDSVFLALFYVFHFGYLYLFLLGMAEYDREVFYNSQYTVEAVYFCTLCISAFLVGYSSLGYAASAYSKVKVNDDFLPQLYLASKALIVVALIFFWVPIFSVFERAFSDYKVLISIGAESGFGKLYWVGQYLGVAALSVFYICKSKLRPRLFSDWFSVLALFYILGYLIIGDRGGFLYFAIIPLLAVHILRRKANGKLLLVFVAIVLLVSSIISTTRTSSIYNPFEAYATYAQYSEEKNNSAVIDALIEFGSSFKTVPIAMSFVPTYSDYWYGRSYWDSFWIVFPQIIGERNVESTDSWLTKTAFGALDETHGRGGSISMESYINFGILGSSVFFLGLGVVLGVVYKKFKFSGSVFFGVFYLSLMAAICLWMRNSSLVVFRTVIWSLLFYYVANFLFSINFRRPILKSKALK